MMTKALAICLMAWSGVALAVKAPHAAKAPHAVKAPVNEKLTCRTGPNDKQVRLIAQLVKGKLTEFAYYSRLGTRVCSIHSQRGDGYTKWQDEAGKSLVRLREGSALVEYQPGFLRIKFEEVGRMPYCGMYGELNGTVEVSKKNTECALNGVFD